MTDGRYWPSLDGVRAVAIAVVIAYHLGDLGGGWIGVDIFFVLSGFLITTLLLDERQRTGSIRLRAFWARRARRLLPAVLLLLLVLCLYAWQGGPGVVPAQLRSPALATLFYSANWQQLAAGHSYFAAFSAPSPLQHTWSLAIEEQYYVVWPLLLGLVLLGRRRGRLRSTGSGSAARSASPGTGAGWEIPGRRRTIAGTAALIVVSAVWMGVAAHVSGPNRAYLGTDTRAWELLLGGLAALCLPPTGTVRRPRMWAAAGVAGAAGVAVGIAFGGGPPAWAWDGGLVGVAACAAVVVVTVTRAPGPVTWVLGLAPLRWLGQISYSLYLWHWPAIVLVNGSSTGLEGNGLLAARLGAMAAGACTSYYLVERPLRRASWRAWWRRGLVPVSIAATATAIVASTVAPAAATSARIVLPPLSPTTSTTAPPLSLPAGEGTPADPWRVWIVGDSVINDASPGITAALDATGNAQVVLNTSFGGWGLTTAHTWQSDAEQAIAANHPQIVIGTWSWDNSMAEQSPAAYEQLLRSYLSVLLSPGDGVDLVVLLQFPTPGPPSVVLDPVKQRADWIQTLTGQFAWDREASRTAKDFRDQALYLQTASLFSPGNRYFAWMRDPAGQWIRARKVDNAHMCPYGAAEFGALLVRELTPFLHLNAPAPGWETASWTHDPRYNDPPGACPADQPPAGYAGTPLPVNPGGGPGQS